MSCFAADGVFCHAYGNFRSSDVAPRILFDSISG
ncbi:MAG: hypothetical protein ACI92S_005054, partial [Planctomycetaceae bacterium]